MMLIGCTADNFTGSTGLANNLVKSGFCTVQTINKPHLPPVVVVAMKPCSLPVDDAISYALEWPQSLGCEKLHFKYCPTFDLSPTDSIGPVAEALTSPLTRPSEQWPVGLLATCSMPIEQIGGSCQHNGACWEG